MFDVSYIARKASYVHDDGTCEYYGLTGNSVGNYGYSGDYDTYGASLIFEYYGGYYWWGYASFSGSPGTPADFTYWYGYTDYLYSSAYYYQYGLVTVQ